MPWPQAIDPYEALVGAGKVPGLRASGSEFEEVGYGSTQKGSLCDVLSISFSARIW